MHIYIRMAKMPNNENVVLEAMKKLKEFFQKQFSNRRKEKND